MALRFTANVDTKASERIIKKLKKLKRPVSTTDAKEIGTAVVDEMKAAISKGISPIEGMGRFEKYRGSYHDQIKSKRNVSVKGTQYTKKLRPVNLNLTGDFLKRLKNWTKGGFLGGFAAVVGFKDQKSRVKERGHREGANNQAKRPIIPQNGEFFSRRIANKVIKILNASIKRVTNSK